MKFTHDLIVIQFGDHGTQAKDTENMYLGNLKGGRVHYVEVTH